MMKLLIVFSFLMVQITTVDAQQYPVKTSKLPTPLVQSFKLHYPDVKVVAWMIEGLNYVAIFKSDGQSLNVCFDAKGTMLYNYFPVERNIIPAKVWKTAAKQKVEKYEPDNFGKGLVPGSDSVYVIQGIRQKDRIFLLINEQGKLIKKYNLTID